MFYVTQKYLLIKYQLIKNCQTILIQTSLIRTSCHICKSPPRNLIAEEINEKVVYNSNVKDCMYFNEKKNKEALAQQSYLQFKSKGPQSIAVKYLINEHISSERNLTDENSEIKPDFPFEKHVELSDVASPGPTIETIDNTNKNLSDHSVDGKWIEDYDKYSEVPVKQLRHEEDHVDATTRNVKYGTPKPSVPPSKVPCGGCGAYLHCQDSGEPGYLPSEIFVGLSETQLQSLVCQRCHFMREYNTALSVSVDPEIYPQLLSRIKSEMALVILVVDMTDFPCSIWPGILDIIGPKRPLFVVGNKIDLLQDWSKGWMARAKESLVKQLPPNVNLLHTTLVSAKTGYGIEKMIDSLYKLWEYRGDVYLVGCTNVGKSTLFNALLQSDYCKTKAVDLVQRATTAPWPGTTLNMLKFPIMRPVDWRLRLRRERLLDPSTSSSQATPYEVPQKISNISRTFDVGSADRSDDYWDDPFAMPKLATLRKLRMPRSGLDPSDPVFANSRWLYDTPGAVTPAQIIDLLTAEELTLTLPQKPIIPRTFQVWAGQSLLIGGLGRVDYFNGEGNIKMTVLAASTLPVTMCYTADAEAVYDHYLGSEAFMVPRGGSERLRLWPGLAACPEFTLRGLGWRESCADVVLSSAGWIAITAQKNSICHLQAWTPKARGMHVRIPPVLPHAINVKGVRMFKSPAFALFNEETKIKKRRS